MKMLPVRQIVKRFQLVPLATLFILGLQATIATGTSVTVKDLTFDVDGRGLKLPYKAQVAIAKSNDYCSYLGNSITVDGRTYSVSLSTSTFVQINRYRCSITHNEIVLAPSCSAVFLSDDKKFLYCDRLSQTRTFFLPFPSTHHYSGGDWRDGHRIVSLVDTPRRLPVPHFNRIPRESHGDFSGGSDAFRAFGIPCKLDEHEDANLLKMVNTWEESQTRVSLSFDGAQVSSDKAGCDLASERFPRLNSEREGVAYGFSGIIRCESLMVTQQVEYIDSLERKIQNFGGQNMNFPDQHNYSNFSESIPISYRSRTLYCNEKPVVFTYWADDSDAYHSAWQRKTRGF